MKKYRSILTCASAAAGMLLMILDASTALSGAAEGLALCINILIPSLFPYFVLSGLLISSMAGYSFSFLRPLGKICGMPQGSESLLVLGFLAGYPAGAQNIHQCWSAGTLRTADARRLLGFCSNAGPAFLFGVISQQFPEIWMVWLLWAIHIISAVMTGILLPGRSTKPCKITPGPGISLPQALDAGLKTIARVCGWVILFRILMSFLEQWFLWQLPQDSQVLLSGLLELSNGCSALLHIENIGVRFVLCAVMLAFGGLCVLMQTASLTGELGLGAYLPGKLLQTLLTFQLSYQLQYYVFPAESRLHLPAILIFFIWIVIFFLKISVAIPRRMVYNPVKS